MERELRMTKKEIYCPRRRHLRRWAGMVVYEYDDVGIEYVLGEET